MLHQYVNRAVELTISIVWQLQHILYRQKEQFSDGVGYSWIDGLKAHAESKVKTLLPLMFKHVTVMRKIVVKFGYL